jgi:hypothetical protein
VRAYGNPATFSRVSMMVREQRRDAKQMANEEQAAAGRRKGRKEDRAYQCGMCATRFLTQVCVCVWGLRVCLGFTHVYTTLVLIHVLHVT